MKRTMTIAMLSACLIALGACGDDGDDGETTGGSGGTTGGSGGAAGNAGEGGSGGSDTGGTGGTTGGSGGTTGGTGGATGGGGGTMAGPVTCGGTECPTAPMGLTACCTEEDTCGERVTGFGRVCAAPVEPHPDCESTTLAFGSRMFTISSCCTAEGQCGLTAPIVQLECTSNEELMEMQNADGGTGDGGAADGGTEDGGMTGGGFRPMITVPDPATCAP